MKTFFEVGLSIVFGFVALAALIGLGMSSVALVISIFDLFISTGIKVGVVQSAEAVVVLLAIFVVSYQLLVYFLKENKK